MYLWTCCSKPVSKSAYQSVDKILFFFWMNWRQMTPFRDTCIFRIIPVHRFLNKQIAVSFKLFPVIGTGNWCGNFWCCRPCSGGCCCRSWEDVMLTYWSNFLLLNVRCLAVAVLPPEGITVNHHKHTVISIPKTRIGMVWTPVGVLERLTTREPDPVSFPGLKKDCSEFWTFTGVWHEIVLQVFFYG